MIISRKSQFLIAIVLTCILTTIHAEQSTPTKRELQYELSTKSIGLRGCPSQTKFTGSFHVLKDRRFRSWVFEISETRLWKQMSEAQRQSITKLQNEYRATDPQKRGAGSPFTAKSDYIHTPEGMVTYRVYGVSEEDTRKMAEAVVEWLDNQALENLESAQKQLGQNKNIIKEAQKEIPKLEGECQRLQKQANEKEKEYKEVNYVDREILDHAENSIEELAHSLRTTDFELAGLKARIDLIGKYKTSGNVGDSATLIKLNQMLITDEIERVGVLARRNAYEAALKLAKEYRDAVRVRRSAFSRKTEWVRKLKDAEEVVPKIERALADPLPDMRPVQVHENKVIIHPVRPNK